ncbi:TP53-target gene 5 protein [Choloepus didactylus]|uniref:TP53-target gene 5 protein n=1 Tax=Choloepus didactylus TaxID=27675 RepID=UPI00189DCDAA|nr:TP53-target gene 5 protein [Choloepus didactylus]
MSPSAKKRPKNRVVSKMQYEEPQDTMSHSVSKVIERNRLKLVLKNLSLLRLLKSSNPRIQELHNLAKRCWKILLRVPKILRISSRDDVCRKVKQNQELQEDECPKEKLESSKLEFIEEPNEMKPEDLSPKVESGVADKVKMSPEEVPPQEEQVEPEVPRTSTSHSLTTYTEASGSQLPRVILLKTHHHRTPMGDMMQLDAANQWVWFEGLPTRVHLPGPRVMCRSSALRCIKRCCTRFCSASLELPMYHLYRPNRFQPARHCRAGTLLPLRVQQRPLGAVLVPNIEVSARRWCDPRWNQGATRGRGSRKQLNARDGREDSRVCKYNLPYGTEEYYQHGKQRVRRDVGTASYCSSVTQHVLPPSPGRPLPPSRGVGSSSRVLGTVTGWVRRVPAENRTPPAWGCVDQPERNHGAESAGAAPLLLSLREAAARHHCPPPLLGRPEALAAPPKHLGAALSLRARPPHTPPRNLLSRSYHLRSRPAQSPPQ